MGTTARPCMDGNSTDMTIMPNVSHLSEALWVR